MRRFGSFVALAALVGLVSLVVSPADAARARTVKEIMGKLNKGPNSLCPSLGKALRSANPSWDDVQKQSKEFVELAEEMTQADPPKGSKASWDKLTKAYVANAKALSTAADKKDKTAAQAAVKSLQGSCKSCHSAHKG